MSREICKSGNLCTGCSACINICPKNCISMKPDADGFLYPQIDEDKCIDCKLCEKICPVNCAPEKKTVESGFVARYKDTEVVINSTSGGMCSAFADYTFSKDGILYGAGYDENMKVRHFGIDKTQKNRVAEMRGSKYVQSDLGTCFKEIKEYLEQGRFVCFIGTPCQVSGLTAFLRKKYENLVTADLVCHGVSSPKVFKDYVEYMSQKYKSSPKDIRFRNKTYGYHSGTMMVEFENGKKYYGSGRVDHMLKAYFAGACSRKCCYECPYKEMSRSSDFTIFDSWHIEKLVDGKADDDKGYTNIFVHTENGAKILEEMSDCLEIWPADPELMKKLDGVMIETNPKMHPGRNDIVRDIDAMGFHEAMQKHLPIKAKDHVIEKIKAILYKLGIMRFLKR